MKISTALLFYIVASICYFISTIIQNETLILCTKPFVSCSILVYYYTAKKSKINILFVVILVLFLVSGIFNIFEGSAALKKVILINLLIYSILVSFIVAALFEKKIKNISNFNLLFIFLTFLFLASLLYLCLGLIFDTASEHYLYIIVYSSVLTILGLLSTILFLTNNKKANVFLVVAGFCYIICDSFYVIYYYYYNFFFFRYVSIIAHIISFFFLVQYYLLSTKNDDFSDIDF